MIDIHCHLLPGIDDGAKNLAETLEMCRIASADGIATIVATPHQYNGIYQNPSATILTTVEDVRAAVREARIPVDILPGADVFIDVDTADKIQRGEIMTINNTKRYFLLEFPAHLIPQNIEKLIFNLLLRNIVPILTHPERIAEAQEHPNRIYDLVSQGVLSQITAMSLTGEFGRRAQQCANTLLRHNLAHIIATDAHSLEGRPPLLSAGVKAASRLVGPELATHMVTTYPALVIQGAPMAVLEPPLPIKRRFFGLW